jgi:hypothetical protein
MAARVYAAISDYRTNTGDTITPDPRVTQLLQMASYAMDRAMTGAVYVTDATTLLPTDPIVIDIFVRATCAQAKFINSLADDDGVDARLDSVSIGGISVHRAAGTTALALPPLGPQALQILQIEGALPQTGLMGW